MAKTTQHPVFGKLIPDQFGEELMFFRQFPAMKPFWHVDSKKQLQDLEPSHRALVKKWDTQPGELPQVCRNYDVLAALQSLGVYEVGLLAAGDNDDVPTAAQVQTWQEFLDQEEFICERACSALLRYYRHLREDHAAVFEGEADCPALAESPADLVSCVRFDGMSLSPELIPGLSSISFGWDVDWDMERGLQMILHRRQVIAVGNSLFGPEDVLGEANFFQGLLNEEEVAAYEDFARRLEQSQA